MPAAIDNRRWGYLAAFSAINFSTGALYVWSLLSVALAAKLTAAGTPTTAAALAPVFGVASGLTPFLMIAGGFINDRFGARWVIFLGGLALAAGYFSCLFASTITNLYVSYGVLVGLGTGLINGCTINSAVKFFPDHRGMAGGIVTAALGAGAAFWPFPTNWILAQWGTDGILVFFGALSLLLIPPLALLVRKPPEETLTAHAGSTPSLRPGEMLRKPSFYVLFVLFSTSATLGLMLISNVSGIAIEQVGATEAAAALATSILSLANTAGRFVSGQGSDWIGRLPALGTALACAAGGLFCLMQASSTNAWLFYLGLIGVGICFGAFIGIFPGLVADQYGPKHNSVNFSILMLGYSVGGLVGPLAIRWVAASGSYQTLYGFSLALVALGLLCLLTFSSVKRRENLTEILSESPTA